MQRQNSTQERATTAILLAAGSSRRFGDENKLAQEIDGKPMLHICIEMLLAAAIHELVLVVDPANQSTIEVIKRFGPNQRLRTILNDEASSGMASSLRSGLGSSHEADAVIVALADMPDVKTVTIDALVTAASQTEKDIVQPVYKGKPGNPVLFKKNQFARLNTIEGDKGAKQLISENMSLVYQLVVDDPGIHIDHDTPGDFK